MKAGRNKTIDIKVDEGREYLEKCMVLSERKSMDEVLDKTILGDTFETLRLLPEKSVDLLIADPPYNLDKDFHGAKGKVVAAELSASHTGELGKTTSAATLFKGEAALRYKNHLGENGVFGLEREAKLSGSVLDAGVKHEFKNRYVDGKAGVSGAAGTAGGGIAGKALLNIKERTITVGGTGGVKFIIGGEVDSEVVIKYGNILDDIKSGKINMK